MVLLLDPLAFTFGLHSLLHVSVPVVSTGPILYIESEVISRVCQNTRSKQAVWRRRSGTELQIQEVCAPVRMGASPKGLSTQIESIYRQTMVTVPNIETPCPYIWTL